MIISDVFYNFIIEMCILFFLIFSWANNQNITHVNFNVFFFKLLKLKLITFLNDISLKFEKININTNIKWNPVFKKSSYIGYYFSNIKKWQK